jgi:hypothetical protein
MTQDAAPDVLRVAALQENDPEIRHQVYQTDQGLDAGLPLRGGGSAVDVPRVGIPRGRVAGCDAHLVEGSCLLFGGRVVVLDTQVPRASALQGHRPGVAKDGQKPGAHAAVERRDEGRPSLPARGAQVIDQLVDRPDVLGVAVPVLPGPERRIRHQPDHTNHPLRPPCDQPRRAPSHGRHMTTTSKPAPSQHIGRPLLRLDLIDEAVFAH